MNELPEPQPEPEPVAKELRKWAEFCCWTTLALSPVLYLVNGAAVSHDQLIVRSALVAIAAAGAVGLRVYAVLVYRRC